MATGSLDYDKIQTYNNTRDAFEWDEVMHVFGSGGHTSAEVTETLFEAMRSG